MLRVTRNALYPGRVDRPLLTPNAVVLVAIDALGRHAEQIGAELGRDSWIRQALIEEALQALPCGLAQRALRRLRTGRRRVSETAADAVFYDLTLNGWLIPRGVHSEATWEIDTGRQDEIDGLWAALTDLERRAVERAAQRTMALSVAWSNKLRARDESRTSTSRSSKP